MLRQLILSGKCGILDATLTAESEWLLAAGVGLELFKQLVLNKTIVINLNEPLNLSAKGVAA